MASQPNYNKMEVINVLITFITSCLAGNRPNKVALSEDSNRIVLGDSNAPN